MTPVFRIDGEWEVFRVEVELDGDWSDAGDNGYFHVNVPVELRLKDRHSGKSKQPFHDFTASGECWQLLGLHATKVESRAMDLCELLSRYLFRVVRHVCSQHREELATMHRTHAKEVS